MVGIYKDVLLVPPCELDVQVTGELFLWVGIKDVVCIWYPFQKTEKLSEEVYSVWALISAFHCGPGVREPRS